MMPSRLWMLVALGLVPVTACISVAHPPAASEPATRLPDGSRQAETAGGLPALSELGSPELIKQYGTGLPVYDLTSAVWLPGAPIAVNGEYDFSVAMMVDDIGPALAAAQRAKRNRELAATLAPFNLSKPTRQILDGLRAQGIHRYALLFGTPQRLELRIVEDRFAVGAERPVQHTVAVEPIARSAVDWLGRQAELNAAMAAPAPAAEVAASVLSSGSAPPLQ